jgi:hypothetical protein
MVRTDLLADLTDVIFGRFCSVRAIVDKVLQWDC